MTLIKTTHALKNRKKCENRKKTLPKDDFYLCQMTNIKAFLRAV